MIAAVGQILLSIWIIASANQARKTIKEENAVMMSVLGSQQNKSDKYRWIKEVIDIENWCGEPLLDITLRVSVLSL